MGSRWRVQVGLASLSSPWGRSAWQLLPLAALLALVTSTQYLFQPFVWRNWPLDEVLVGWIEVLRDHLVVASAIGAAIVTALRVPLRRRGARAALLAAAIFAGACGGEALMSALGWPASAESPIDLAERTLRWAVFAGGIVGLGVARQRALAADDAMRNEAALRSRAQVQLSALRLQALQSQIEPHFLFNTLATVKRLGSTEPVRCGRLLDHLHTFIRLSQAAHPGDRRWTLGQELEMVRAYLSVVEMRMNGRLRVRIEIDERLFGNLELPPLALGTLVENAVKHGITPATEGGEIVVDARREDGMIELRVADTGVGLRGEGGTGIGLANTRERLRTLHGGRAGVTLAANRPSGVIAALQWPEVAA
jgi:signal transduction histidine kinase